jgi:hypothetical protein
MLRLLTDENFNDKILRALRRRLRNFDYIAVHLGGMSGFTDEQLLEWAAKESRVIVTHDVKTMPRHAVSRMAEGLRMPGLGVVPNQLDVGRAVADLEVLFECSAESDLNNRIYYLPL